MTSTTPPETSPETSPDTLLAQLAGNPRALELALALAEYHG